MCGDRLPLLSLAIPLHVAGMEAPARGALGDLAQRDRARLFEPGGELACGANLVGTGRPVNAPLGHSAGWCARSQPATGWVGLALCAREHICEDDVFVELAQLVCA